jgi:hypothetical protein
VRAAYTPALEKAHSELLPDLARPRLSVGLDVIAMGRLMRHGGSGYVPRHKLPELVECGLKLVADAPVLEQPVFLATHIRRCKDPVVLSAARSLQSLVAQDEHDG